MIEANARQVAGTHYRTAYQHWDLVADVRLGYYEGQVAKYVTRYHKKNGGQDLRKAEHFAEKLMELAADDRVAPPGVLPPLPFANWLGRTVLRLESSMLRRLHRMQTERLVEEYAQANGLNAVEHNIIRTLATWEHLNDLDYVRRAVRTLIMANDTLSIHGAADGEAGPGYVDQDR